MSRDSIGIHEKYALTVEEAAAYFNIGPKKLRTIANENLYTGIVFQNGTKLLFKRALFEDFLNQVTSI